MTAQAGAGRAGTAGATPLQAMCVLLLPVAAPRDFAGFAGRVDGIDPLPAEAARARMDQLHEVQAALLGHEYLESRRLTRWPLGRVRLPGDADGQGPDCADLFLVTHTAGAAVWEAWMSVPDQPLDPARLIAWLLPDQGKSPAAVVRERVGTVTRRVLSAPEPDEAFPFTILRLPSERTSLDDVVANLAEDLVRVLYLDRSHLSLKRRVVDEELARDFCLREGGISLLSIHSALDLRVGEGMGTDPASATVLAPRNALPLLVSVELLLIERAVLRLFHRRLQGDAVPRSLPRLIELKAEVLDGLAEYRGTVAESNRFSTEVTSYGEAVLGLDVLYATLTERLDALTFEITTVYQQSTNVLQFALTVVVGSFQAASVAAVIAAVAYRQEPGLVFAWAGGVAIAAAASITAVLHRRLH